MAAAILACGNEPAPAARHAPPLVRHERVALDGDPAIGTVVLVREIHGCAPELLPQLGDERQQDQLVAAVLAYQLEILRELDRRDALHVFADGVGAAWVADYLRPSDSLLDQTRAEFGRIPDDAARLTPWQSSVLFQIGAAYAHAARRPEVTVHETEDDEVFALGWASNTVDHPELAEHSEYLLFDAREAAIAMRVRAFLREHPGETAVLILGRDHRITDDLSRGGDPPRVVAVWWGDASIPGQDLEPLGDP